VAEATIATIATIANFKRKKLLTRCHLGFGSESKKSQQTHIVFTIDAIPITDLLSNDAMRPSGWRLILEYLRLLLDGNHGCIVSTRFSWGGQ
jgi:hypothetical protein